MAARRAGSGSTTGAAAPRRQLATRLTNSCGWGRMQGCSACQQLHLASAHEATGLQSSPEVEGRAKSKHWPQLTWSPRTSSAWLLPLNLCCRAGLPTICAKCGCGGGRDAQVCTATWNRCCASCGLQQALAAPMEPTCVCFLHFFSLLVAASLGCRLPDLERGSVADMLCRDGLPAGW